MNSSATESQTKEPEQAGKRFPPLPLWLRAFHGFAIVWLGMQAIYAAWQIFVVLQPIGVVGPMFGHARDLSFDEMVIRRLYASEAWTSFGALVLYVAITEILPRRLRIN